MPTLSIDGCDIGYEIQGQGEGPPIAFLNGVLMTVESWALQSRHFRRCYRCLLHDFRGQLLSGKPPGPYSMEQHAGDLLRLLDHLRVERCHLVGTSYGGEVALAFAAARPERAASLTVIASVARVEPDLRRRVDAWAEAALTDPGDFYRAVARDSYSEGFLERNRNLLAQGQARLEEYPADFFSAFAELVKAFTAFDVTDRLASVACPTLVVAGELDALKPPRYSREIAAAIPGAELVVVAGAGHAVVIEKAREVNEIVGRFLAQTEPASRGRAW